MPPRDRTRRTTSVRTPVDWQAVEANVTAFRESARVLGRFASTIEPLAPWEAELLGAVNPPETTVVAGTTEGEEVPPRIENVTVEPSASVRCIAFDANEYTTRLSSTLDDEVWLSTLREFREASQPFEVGINVGEFSIPQPSLYVPNYGQVNVDQLSLDVAAEMVRIASDGRVLFAQVNPENENNWRLAPTSALEDVAWQRFWNGSIAVRNDWDESDTASKVPTRTLKSHMQQYATFRQSERRRMLREVMQERMIGGLKQVTPADQQGFTMERVRRFQSFINKVKGQLVVERHPFRHMDLLPHGTLSSRRWGIEIESPFIDGVQTPKGWVLKHDGSLRGLQEANHAPYLEHGDECAFFSETQNCDCGLGNDTQAERNFNDSSYPTLHNPTLTGEWNSPVLRSYHSRGLEYMTGELEHRKVNDTASCHVHVQAKDLTPEQVVRLALIFSALEPLWEAEYFRAARRYCKPLDTDMLIDRFKMAKTATRARDMVHSGKYFSVNFNSLSQHGTVEFRTMGPRYNYKHLIRWASFCREMVNIAKADVPQREWAKVRTFQDLIVLFSKYGKETATPPWAKKQHATNPADTLGKELRRLPNEVTQADGVTDQHDDYYTKQPVAELVTLSRW